ncbi:RNA-dependent RNA polymerase [Citrus virus B]|nr:RNA-dependent RNA polymerase [Citrus virus B]
MGYTKPPRSHYESINDFLQEAIPMVDQQNYKAREMFIETEDIDLGVNNIRIADTRRKFILKPINNTSEIIRSQLGGNRLDSMKQNLLTIDNRNFNAPPSNELASDEVIANNLLEAVFSKFINLQKFCDIYEERIGVNPHLVSDWLDTRSPEKYKSLLKKIRPENDLVNLMSRFKIMMKAEPKPKLDPSILNKYAVGQNIVYHDQQVNLIMSPIFRYIQDCLVYSLNGNCLLYNKITNSDFSSAVNDRICGSLQDYSFLELDFSKFDKSQHRAFKLYEKKFYEMFNIDDEMLAMWFKGEMDALGSTNDKSIQYDFGVQRRTGASNTWLGNTLVTMGILAYYYKETDGLFLVSGDDSLIISTTPSDNFCELINKDTGFECKFIKNALPYFCSKYLISMDNTIIFVPDPFKLFVKFGKTADEVKEIISDLFQSFLDLTQDIIDNRVIDLLAMYSSIRYGVTYGTAYMAICCIPTLRANKQQFSRIFGLSSNIICDADL